MIYLPDTKVWIRHLDYRPSNAKERLAACDPDDVVMCDVVKAELYFGAFKSARPAQNLVVLQSLFDSFKSLPFDGEAARVRHVPDERRAEQDAGIAHGRDGRHGDAFRHFMLLAGE